MAGHMVVKTWGINTSISLYLASPCHQSSSKKYEWPFKVHVLKVMDTIQSVHLQTYGHMHPMWVSSLHKSKASDQTGHEFCSNWMLTNQKQIKAPTKERDEKMKSWNIQRPKRVVLFSILSLHPLHHPSLSREWVMLQLEQPSSSQAPWLTCKYANVQK